MEKLARCRHTVGSIRQEGLQFAAEHLPRRFRGGQQVVVAAECDQAGIGNQPGEFLTEAERLSVIIA